MTNKLTITFMFAMAGLVALSNELVQHQINDYWTWGAFTYPFTFLLCDLCVRFQGASVARRMVLVGFALGVLLSVFIDLRIAIASGTAFLTAQMLDVEIFKRLNKKQMAWWVAPALSSSFVAVIDTLLFFGIAFYGTEVPWVTLSVGDYAAKLMIILLSLLPYRLLLPLLRA